MTICPIPTSVHLQYAIAKQQTWLNSCAILQLGGEPRNEANCVMVTTANYKSSELLTNVMVTSRDQPVGPYQCSVAPT